MLDSLLFGGELLVPFLHHPNFHFVKTDVTEPRAVKDSPSKAIGPNLRQSSISPRSWDFPACQAVGRQAAWRYNVEATKLVFEQAAGLGSKRFVFASTYSNYGLSTDGKPVTEELPLNPQSLYAETKIAAEEFLLSQRDACRCAAVVSLRHPVRNLAAYALRPDRQPVRTGSVHKRELIIYQRGYSVPSSMCATLCAASCSELDAPESKIRGQVYNLGTDSGNYTKDEIVNLVLKRMPETVVEYKDLTFGGDMRDITVSFEKVKRELGFDTTLTVDDGIRELVFALKSEIDLQSA